MASNDYSKLVKREHYGKWIALKNDYSTIVGYADTLTALRSKIENKGVIYTKVLDKDYLYAF